MKYRIHVNQHNIKHNTKNPGDLKPVLISRTHQGSSTHQELILKHNGVEVGRFVYRPNKPLSCGARVWFETTNLEVVPA